MRRRHNIFFLVILLTLLSCSKNEDTPIIPDKGSEIEFGNIATKAVKDATDITGFEVSIAATNAITGADYVSLLENEPVTPNDDHSEWNYEHTRYWMDGIHYYFVASYSYSLDDPDMQNIGAFEELEDVQQGYRQLGYVLDVNTDGTEAGQNARVDILTATDYVHTDDSWTTSNVGLTFSHLLTKVNFRISQDLNRDDINKYFITKVTLSGVTNEGRYIVAPENGTFARGWTLGASESSYQKSFDGVSLSKLNESTSKVESTPLLVWGDDGLLLIPQVVGGGDMTIRIDYKHQYVDNDEQTEDIIAERFIEADIPATDLWKSNNVITYNISIANPNKIIFSNPTVQSWGNPQTGGMIIIK